MQETIHRIDAENYAERNSLRLLSVLCVYAVNPAFILIHREDR